MDVETLVRISKPSVSVEAVKITDSNGSEIAERWKNITHDAERNVLEVAGLSEMWLGPGQWIIGIPDSSKLATFCMTEETLFQSYRRMDQLESEGWVWQPEHKRYMSTDVAGGIHYIDAERNEA